jgi:hypothetical protein
MFALPDSTPEILGLKTAVLKPVLMGSASMTSNKFIFPSNNESILSGPNWSAEIVFQHFVLATFKLNDGILRVSHIAEDRVSRLSFTPDVELVVGDKVAYRTGNVAGQVQGDRVGLSVRCTTEEQRTAKGARRSAAA